MALTAGARIGGYEIVAWIGAGGMGEVYRARDAKLRRDVAIKLLSPGFAADPDRLARFDREAQVLASLNHPNIAAIYGVEDAGGAQALVLEYVDGPTLADRIARGPIPIDEALPIAKQIATALEAAHALGIVHRDLKPANIKLRPDGTVKVLDFGLAKAAEPATDAIDASVSPTMTSPAMTRAGVILGTAAYMSPEQARGRQADKRSDVWAFGCVLYEMFTGARTFGGDDATETIAAVVRADPDWTKLPAETPAPVRRLLRRSLTKTHAQRLADIADARLEIEDAIGGDAAAATPGRSGSNWLVISAAFVAGAVLAAVAAARYLTPPPAAAAPAAAILRSSIDLPKDAPLALGSELPAIGYDSPVVALSPDGASLAYVAGTPSGRMLYLRDMATGDVRVMPGTEGIVHPFFSPDGQWIGFLTIDHVKKVSRQNGTVISLCEAQYPVLAWWLDPTTIFFTEFEATTLSKVASDGGARQRLTAALDVGIERFDDVLPGGRNALGGDGTSVGGDFDNIVLVDLQTKSARTLIRAGYAARYIAPGYIAFARSGNLMAVRFDAASGQVTGDPVTIAAGVATESLFGMLHAVSSNTGVLAYVPGADLSVGKLAWVSRSGVVDYLDVPERVYGVVDVSPDGTRIAVQVADVNDFIWIWDSTRGDGHRVPNAGAEGFPAWSPDGRRLAGIGVGNLYKGKVLLHDVEPGGAVGPGIELKGSSYSTPSWSPHGDILIVNTYPDARVEFFGLDKPVTVPSFPGLFAAFSPDGRWIAYGTFASDLVIQSFPEGTVFGQISAGAGGEPRWKRSGDLFYRIGRRWYATRVTTNPQPKWDPPRLVFDTEFIDTPGMSYDISPDGQRLMVVKRVRSQQNSRIEILSNWPALLERASR
jgi:Tol biopolymer transport system component